MRTTSSRRLQAALLAAALTGGGLLAAATPAQAVVLGTAQTKTQVTFDDNATGTTCDQTGPGAASSATVPFAADGVPVSTTAASSAVITDHNNAADVTTLSGSVTHAVTATQAGGQLSHLHVTSTGTATATTAIAASKCQASALVGGQSQFQFDLVTPTLVTVTAESHRMVGVIEAGTVSGQLDGDLAAVIGYAIGSHGTSTSTALLPAGTAYIGISQTQTGVSAATTATTKTTTGDVVLDVSFDTPGTASSVQSGSASKYVTFGAARSCTAGSLPLTWSKKVSKGKKIRLIKKATVTVNGAKVATVKKPKKNQVTTLTGLNAEKAADVEVSFVIKSKNGKKKTYTAERSYLRCS